VAPEAAGSSPAGHPNLTNESERVDLVIRRVS